VMPLGAVEDHPVTAEPVGRNDEDRGRHGRAVTA
jgi:hypothetical protein